MTTSGLLFYGEITVGKIIDAQVLQGADTQAVLAAIGKGRRNLPQQSSRVGRRCGNDHVLLSAFKKQDGHIAAYSQGSPKNPDLAAIFKHFAAIGEFNADGTVSGQQRQGQKDRQGDFFDGHHMVIKKYCQNLKKK